MEPRTTSAPASRQGGVRPFHVLGTIAVAVLGVVVAFWALAAIVGIIWFLVKVAVLIGVVLGVVWLFARSRHR